MSQTFQMRDCLHSSRLKGENTYRTVTSFNSLGEAHAVSAGDTIGIYQILPAMTKENEV